jgi:hypothetical protein
MSNEDRRDASLSNQGPRAPRLVRPIILLFLAASIVATVFMLVAKGGGSAEAYRDEMRDSPSPSNLHTTTSIDEQGELIARLKEILITREQAYRKKNPETLKEIYTVDCPCLESDSNAIRELIDANYVWVGGESSVQVRRTDRVTARMWIIIADLSSEPLRVETESGRLIRSEPRGRDLFQFVLARPAGSTKWMLGRASSYKDG